LENKKVEQVLPRGGWVGGKSGEVVQIMHTHVSNCKSNKIKLNNLLKKISQFTRSGNGKQYITADPIDMETRRFYEQFHVSELHYLDYINKVFGKKTCKSL
jgi:hypothetical protein